VVPSPDCATLHASDKTKCSICNVGFYVGAGDLCVPCGNIAGCTSCTNAGVCTACTAPQIPQVGGATCVTPSPDCTTLNSTDHLLCQTCNSGFHLLATNLCATCGSAMTDCTACTSASVCTACTAPKVIQIGGGSCVTPSPNCGTLHATDKTLCSVCNSGFLLDASFLCVPCSTIAGCTTCTSAGVCSACTAP
jgi:hypothetical protein